MKFRYFGEEFEGVDHSYNDTACNERFVELAVAFDWFAGLPPADGLEVGNVVSHYFGLTGHRVVDLYEVAEGVDNIDVFDITGRYSWILSVSTLEHIGDAVGALDHLRSLLAPDGRMLVTIGSGQHQALDNYLATGAGAERCCTLIRGGDGGWHQTEHLTFLQYGLTTRWAESVWIGEFSG